MGNILKVRGLAVYTFNNIYTTFADNIFNIFLFNLSKS